VGTGWWATYAHIPALREHAGAELVALSDPNAEKLATVASAFGVRRTFTDPMAMLDD
jgi:predicted dehydrogenase